MLEHVADSDDLEADLAVLLRRHHPRARRYPEAEYVFRHGLLRQACLSTLPPDRRRELYGAVAAAFETLFAASLDDHLEVLAHYYSRSHDLGQGARVPRAGRREGGRARRHAAGGRALGERALKVAEARTEDRERVERVLGRLAQRRDRRRRLVEAARGSKPTAIALIADIHGNLPALDAVLEELEREGVDQILCLGDVAVGPQPTETLERVRELGCPVVMGNWDAYFLRRLPGAGGRDRPSSWSRSARGGPSSSPPSTAPS